MFVVVLCFFFFFKHLTFAEEILPARNSIGFERHLNIKHKKTKKPQKRKKKKTKMKSMHLQRYAQKSVSAEI